MGMFSSKNYCNRPPAGDLRARGSERVERARSAAAPLTLAGNLTCDNFGLFSRTLDFLVHAGHATDSSGSTHSSILCFVSVQLFGGGTHPYGLSFLIQKRR
jgi:hypothetical protein